MVVVACTLRRESIHGLRSNFKLACLLPLISSVSLLTVFKRILCTTIFSIDRYYADIVTDSCRPFRRSLQMQHEYKLKNEGKFYCISHSTDAECDNDRAIPHYRFLVTFLSFGRMKLLSLKGVFGLIMTLLAND